MRRMAEMAPAGWSVPVAMTGSHHVVGSRATMLSHPGYHDNRGIPRWRRGALRVRTGASPIAWRRAMPHAGTMMNDTTTTDRTASDPVRSLSRLQRPHKDRVVAGVAVGLANHYEVGVGWVRLAFVVLAFFGGFGVLLYLLGWLGIPEEDATGSLAARKVRDLEGVRSWIGLGLIVLAAMIILGESGLVRPGLIWAGALILVGVLLYRGDLPEFVDRPPSRGEGDSPPPPGETPPVPTREWAPASTEGMAGIVDVAAEATPPSTAEDGDVTLPPVPPGEAPSRAPEVRPSRPRRSMLGRLTLATMLIVLGVVGMLHSAEAITPTARHYAAIAVATIGLGLVIGAWWGRARALVLLGILMLPFLAGATLVRVPLHGGFGDPVYRPVSVDEIEDEYRLIAGEMTLDLGDIDLGEGAVDMDASIAFGLLRVIVPADAGVEIVGRVGGGELDFPGLQADGVDVERRTVLDGIGRISLDLEVGFGEIRVFRTER